VVTVAAALNGASEFMHVAKATEEALKAPTHYYEVAALLLTRATAQRRPVRQGSAVTGLRSGGGATAAAVQAAAVHRRGPVHRHPQQAEPPAPRQEGPG
jgi:hypothetical protein